jgi:murein DD-endopeptidase MepM/ murein hydrolase activator NlpD
MCKVPSVFGSHCVVRFAFAGMTAALLAGCADSSRLMGDSLGNPFKSAQADPAPAPTYDRDMSPPAYSPRTPVVSRPLAPPAGMPYRNTASYGGSQHVASYEAPAHTSPSLSHDYRAPRTERTASIASSNGRGTWTAEGGMAVIAAQGENGNILGERYNVPTDALLRANNLTSSSQVHAGTRLVIPVYNANGGSSTRVASTEPVREMRPEPVRKPHDHASRERLMTHQIAQRDGAKHEQVAKAETMHWVKGPAPAGEKSHGREQAMAKMKPTKADKPVDVADSREAKKLARDQAREQAKMAKMEAAKPTKMAKVEQEEKPAAVDPTPTASLPPANEKVSANGNPEFRWPAHGRIIQGFKSGGNDGINIAVPEGTSVKAAESGVVAYAGSEIKGFGNLVLIRHPNGYVSAYANNGDIEVKRGEQVKRGQTIAKSGQSGNVASPQLHFELRKGSTPVDPTRYLAGL